MLPERFKLPASYDRNVDYFASETAELAAERATSANGGVWKSANTAPEESNGMMWHKVVRVG